VNLDLIYPLPVEGSDKWKIWRKRGYEDWSGKIDQFPALLNTNRTVESKPEVPAKDSEPEVKLTRAQKKAAKVEAEAEAATAS